MELKISGIIFLVAAWGFVLILTVYCFAKVLRPRGKSQS